MVTNRPTLSWQFLFAADDKFRPNTSRGVSRLCASYENAVFTGLYDVFPFHVNHAQVAGLERIGYVTGLPWRKVQPVESPQRA
jgi:hypothetical protein